MGIALLEMVSQVREQPRIHLWYNTSPYMYVAMYV